jgi:hypothetical protein
MKQPNKIQISLRLFLVVLFLGISADIKSQIHLWRKNQCDNEGKKHGYWVVASRSDPGKIAFRGWYDHGKETRHCTYYNEGVRWSKFRYVNDSLIRIRRYDGHGHLEYKGTALWLTNSEEMRFCWDGEFVFYDSHRHKVRKAMYIRGEEQDLE